MSSSRSRFSALVDGVVLDRSDLRARDEGRSKSVAGDCGAVPLVGVSTLLAGLSGCRRSLTFLSGFDGPGLLVADDGVLPCRLPAGAFVLFGFQDTVKGSFSKAAFSRADIPLFLAMLGNVGR